MYDTLSRGDPLFFERHLSREDAVIIGTAPDEWWNDGHAALAAIGEQMKKAGTALRVTPGELQAFSEGAVGWIADRPTLTVGGVSVRCRHTAVFVRRVDEWQLVQQHFSIGVPNDEAFGAEASRL
jgi:hypothetical protein